MEFPGRIYLRAEDDINSPEHQAVVNNWICEFERSRRTFVFPEKPIRSIGYIFIVVGLISMIVQVTTLLFCFLIFVLPTLNCF